MHCATMFCDTNPHVALHTVVQRNFRARSSLLYKKTDVDKYFDNHIIEFDVEA